MCMRMGLLTDWQTCVTINVRVVRENKSDMEMGYHKIMDIYICIAKYYK